jgi:hypothetical protein
MPRHIILYEKLIAAQLVKCFLPFYESKLHYRVHKIQPLIPVVNLLNLSRAFSYLSRYVIMLYPFYDQVSLQVSSFHISQSNSCVDFQSVVSDIQTTPFQV